MTDIERDARRYRFLQAQAELPSHERRIWVAPPAPAAACNSADELDAAIDAEMEDDASSQGT